MNFSGWVAIPRSILNNTHTCKLSNSEQLVLLTLMLLVDAKTGSGYINAAAIRAYLPDLKYDTAKRVLKSLEDKLLIYRQIKHHSNDLYPYWIHAYQVSDGPHRMLWTDLSQVFATKDVTCVLHVESAPATPPAIPPATPPAIPPAGALHNNNDKDNDLHKDKPTYPLESELGVSEKVSANVSESVSHSGRECEFEVSEKVSEKVSRSDGDACQLPTGFELRDDGCVYGPGDLKVAPNIVAAMLTGETQ